MTDAKNIATQTTPKTFDAHTLLDSLLAVLEEERTALIAADASTVVELAPRKEQLGGQLHAAIEADKRAWQTAEKRARLRTIATLSQENHLFLEQLYQHHQGIVEMFAKIYNGPSTYGRQGTFAGAPAESAPSGGLSRGSL